MYRWAIISLVVALSSGSVAHAQNRGVVTITVAGAGFGFGLWLGLSAFDDAVNSDRKVWTSAIAGAGVGAVAGYLIGRARSERSRPAVSALAIPDERRDSIDPRVLAQVAKTVRFDRGLVQDDQQSIRLLIQQSLTTP